MMTPPATAFDCLWCGRPWQPRSRDDLEAWARLCPDCLGNAGDNGFLRFRLRRALAERAAATGQGPRTGSAGPPTDQPQPQPQPLAAPPTPHAAAEVPTAQAVGQVLDDWYLRRGPFARGPLHDVAWQADLDAAGRWLDDLPLGPIIVELGDGTGWWSPLLAGKGELWSFDADPAALDRTRERLLAHRLRAHLHVRDPWSEPDRQVDALFSAFRLGRLSPARWAGCLSIVRRWLRPGGVFAFVELAARADEGGDLTRAGGLAVPGPVGPAALRQALEVGGFEDVELTEPGRSLVLGRATA